MIKQNKKKRKGPEDGETGLEAVVVSTYLP
jgi:hypothetical protein